MCYNRVKEESVELKRHLDLRYLFVGLYVVLFVVYIIVGLQPAGAVNYEVSANLNIPSIGLDTDVTSLTLEDNRLNTPDTIVGSYSQAKNKTLLIGHSTTIFENLRSIIIGEKIIYNDKSYEVAEYYVEAKNDISMTELLQTESRDTIVLMTCAGTLLDGGDATHRLIVVAIRD